jgi:hypothetical protein
MSTADLVAAFQTSGPQTTPSNPPAAGYFVIGLLAAVLGLIVWIFIRTSSRRSSNR